MEFTKEQISVLIANKIIPVSANAKQTEYFFEVCRRKKLDPFLKQIHMIERKEKKDDNWITSYTIQASLDGMRAIAQRNCKIKSYKRWTEVREGYDGKKQIYGCCEIDTEDRGLYSDQVPFSEYVQMKKDGTITHFWKQFPETMIKKVAEESVLRMVSPEDLSGVYGDDEMDQAETKPLEIEVHHEEIAAQRNFTAEASNCLTLPELKAWWESLSAQEKKICEAVKKNRKEEIETELKNIDPTDPLGLNRKAS